MLKETTKSGCLMHDTIPSIKELSWNTKVVKEYHGIVQWSLQSTHFWETRPRCWVGKHHIWQEVSWSLSGNTIARSCSQTGYRRLSRHGYHFIRTQCCGQQLATDHGQGFVQCWKWHRESKPLRTSAKIWCVVKVSACVQLGLFCVQMCNHRGFCDGKLTIQTFFVTHEILAMLLSVSRSPFRTLPSLSSYHLKLSTFSSFAFAVPLSPSPPSPKRSLEVL